jgi:hypothetical protein
MIIELSNDVVSAVFGANSATFTSLLPIYIIMIGIPLVFYVLRKIILLFPRK